MCARPLQFRSKDKGGLGLSVPFLKAKAFLVKNMLKDNKQYEYDPRLLENVYGDQQEGNAEGVWLELQNGKAVKISGRVDRIEGNFGPSYECMMIWAILTTFMKWLNTWLIFKDYG